jgi:CHAD domain-containing protein
VAVVTPPARRGPALSADDPVHLAARAVVRFHLRTVATVEGAARAGEVPGVHALRVGTRRLRATLRLFGSILPARASEAADRDLAWLADAIGEVRDCDVLAGILKERAGRLDPEVASALGPVGLAVHEERTAALEALVHVLDSPRCRALFGRLAQFTETSPRRVKEPSLGSRAADLVRPLVRAVVRAGRAVGPASPPAEMHRLRVRIKRLRYALETLAFGGKNVRRATEELERLQDRFGAHQDAVAAQAWLWRYARTPGVDAASLLPVGAIIQALAKRAAKDRRRALKAWRKVERTRILATLGLGHARRRAALQATG